MPQYLIHKDGAWNIYCTISDGAWFEHAVDQAELEAWYVMEHGRIGAAELPSRIDRAIRTGTSARTGESLDDLIAGNRAGPGEKRLNTDEFVRRYLTLPANA